MQKIINEETLGGFSPSLQSKFFKISPKNPLRWVPPARNLGRRPGGHLHLRHQTPSGAGAGTLPRTRPSGRSPRPSRSRSRSSSPRRGGPNGPGVREKEPEAARRAPGRAGPGTRSRETLRGRSHRENEVSISCRRAGSSPLAQASSSAAIGVAAAV